MTKRLLTAIGDEIINQKIKEKGEYEVIGKDIQYQEGIFEILEKEEIVDFLMVSDFLIGEDSISELLEKIKRKNNNINIILIFSEETEEVQDLLKKKIIIEAIPFRKLLENNKKINKNENLIFQENIEKKELIKEIEKLKQEITEIKQTKKIIKKDCLIIQIIGDRNVGKTSIALLLAKMAPKRKVLLIDFNKEKKSLIKILKKEGIKEKEIKINKKIYISEGMGYYKNIKDNLDKLRNKYDLIVIDTNTDNVMKINKELSENIDLNVFVIESTYLGCVKAKDFFYRKRNIFDFKKTKVLFNNFSKHSMSVAKMIASFSEFTVLGVLRKRKIYEKNINYLYQENHKGIRLRLEYRTIYNRIFYSEKMSEIEWVAKIRKIR